jgi:hypothetical protein
MIDSVLFIKHKFGYSAHKVLKGIDLEFLWL